MPTQSYKIEEVKNEIDDHLLDIIGASFNFDHIKGLSEWLKNSVDAYIRSQVADKDQFVIFRFADGKHNDATIECIDFNGMSENDIEKALKRWGDPQASKRGTNIKDLKTFGGHGNGGKFYMRQMFETSQFITYKNGLLNVFGFSKNKKYGFAEGFRNKPMTPDEALSYAGLDKAYIPKLMLGKVRLKETGFTVAQGVGPATMPNVPKVNFIVGQIVNHPQSQRIISRIPVKVVYNNRVQDERLKIEKLKPMSGFEELQPIPVPDELLYETDSERIVIPMKDDKYPAGKLQLFTSELPLPKGNKLGEKNRIDVIGELGVIGSYKVFELGINNPQAVFIYGDLEVPILEKPGSDCVQNDRAKLIENPTTKALLDWVSLQIIELCKQIGEKERQERAEKMKDISSSLNQYLNQWKDKFMSKILSEVLVGAGSRPGRGIGDGTGGGGGASEGDGDKVNKPSETDGEGSGFGGGHGDGGAGDDDNKGGGDTPKKTQRSPKVLLSDQDSDPLSNTGESITLSPRQPAVYQRQQDVDEGIYWINTSAPLAKSILDRYAQNDARWRDYLFQRYVDIFIREALSSFEKKDPDDFTSASVEQKINEVIIRIHEAAANELSSFLFEDNFDVE